MINSDVAATDSYFTDILLSSSTPNTAFMRRWSKSALVQVMLCRLFGAKLAITWTNADLLSIGHSGTNLSEIWIEIQSLSSMKMHLKMSAKWRPFCPGEMS